MIREIREEIQAIREPLMDADASARADVEADVPRDVGERRFVTAACGPSQPEFDPANNADHQDMAARLSRLQPATAELREDVQRDQELVDSLPAHPLLWYLLLLVAVPTELLCGIQLFQTMGTAPSYRIPAALGLLTGTFLVVGLVRSTAVSASEQTGWRRLLAWARVGLAALVATIVAICIGFARVDPTGSVGLPTAVRASRLVLLVMITVGPAVLFKYAVDQLKRTLKPRRNLKAHRRQLKRLEREHAELTREVAGIRQAAARWRVNVASQVAKYQAAHDRANAARNRRGNS